ncbi:GroES-like protein [Ceratobasidium sp. AG-I]|nr:GroES-like protein [Ceratobasidium sp. AG-I]
MVHQQKASLLLEKHGKFEVGTRPIPTPQGKEVVVKVTAAAINPIDYKIVDFGVFINQYPAVLGIDGAGVIESLGPEVKNYKKGDRVFFQGQTDPADMATFQQYTLVDSELMSRTPGNITDDQAATIPLGSITSVAGLFQKSGVAFPENGPTTSKKSILILGGSSSLGQYAIQLARIAGFSTIVTTASAQHAEHLKSLGATHVFDRNANVKTVQQAFPTPPTLAFNPIGSPETQSFALDVLIAPAPTPGAHFSSVSPLSDELKAKSAAGGVATHQVFGSSHKFREMAIPFWRSVAKWIEEGTYVPNRVQLVEGGLAAIPEALDLSRKGVSGVKIVIRPQE